MTSTAAKPAPPGEQEVHETASARPTSKRRVMIIAVASNAFITLLALIIGRAIFDPAAASDTETPMTAMQVIP